MSFPILTVDGFVGRRWVIDDYFKAGEVLHCGDIVSIKKVGMDPPRVFKIGLNQKDDRNKVIGVVSTPNGLMIGDEIASAVDDPVPIVVKGITRTAVDGSVTIGDSLIPAATFSPDVARVKALDITQELNDTHTHKLASIAVEDPRWSAGQEHTISLLIDPDDPAFPDATDGFGVGFVTRSITTPVNYYTYGTAKFAYVVGKCVRETFSENGRDDVIDILVDIAG